MLHSFAAGLAEHDWMLWEGFLRSGEVAELRREAKVLKAQGHFRPAGLGHMGDRDERIRGDEILWLEPELAPAAASLLHGELEALRLAINEATYLGVHDFEGHYATYLPGAAYEKHLDRFREDNLRVISLVLYLNEGWSEEDGGHLQLYPPGGATVRVAPHGGTLLCFLSEALPHEVEPARRTRFSLTGWFRRRA